MTSQVGYAHAGPNLHGCTLATFLMSSDVIGRAVPGTRKGLGRRATSGLIRARLYQLESKGSIFHLGFWPREIQSTASRAFLDLATPAS